MNITDNKPLLQFSVILKTDTQNSESLLIKTHTFKRDIIYDLLVNMPQLFVIDVGTKVLPIIDNMSTKKHIFYIFHRYDSNGITGKAECFDISHKISDTVKENYIKWVITCKDTPFSACLFNMLKCQYDKEDASIETVYDKNSFDIEIELLTFTDTISEIPNTDKDYLLSFSLYISIIKNTHSIETNTDTISEIQEELMKDNCIMTYGKIGNDIHYSVFHISQDKILFYIIPQTIEDSKEIFNQNIYLVIPKSTELPQDRLLASSVFLKLHNHFRDRIEVSCIKNL
jgi:hypothetical protein